MTLLTDLIMADLTASTVLMLTLQYFLGNNHSVPVFVRSNR